MNDTPWICAACGYRLHPETVVRGGHPRAWCPRCLASGAWVPGGSRPVDSALAAAERPTTAAAVCRRSWALTTCPETGLAWAPPALAMLFGLPGAGKSTLALQIAASASRPIAFVAAEQPAGPPLARMLHLAGLSSRTDCAIYRRADASDLARHAAEGDVILLDSIQMLTLRPEDARQLCDLGASLVIVVSQSRKDGWYRGESGWLHEADLALQVEDGGWTAVKSRFQPAGATGPIRGVNLKKGA